MAADAAAGMSSTLRYAVQTHESTFSDSLLSSLPEAPPIIELVVAAAAALLLPFAIEDVALAPELVAPVPTTDVVAVELVAAAAAAVCPLDLVPLSLAQLNLSPQLPFLDLAPVADVVVAAATGLTFPAPLLLLLLLLAWD